MPILASAPDAPSDPQRVAAALVAEHAFIWRCVRRFGVAEAHVDDVVQEVFIIFNRKIAEVEVGKERAFLTSTAFHLAANWRRSHRRTPPTVELDAASAAACEGPSAEELLDRRRARELLDVCLDELPEKLRAPFVLQELEGLTRQEVAELLSLPTGTVATRVRAARNEFGALVRRRTAFPLPRSLL